MGPFQQVRERPSGEEAEDGLIQFHAGLMQAGSSASSGASLQKSPRIAPWHASTTD